MLLTFLFACFVLVALTALLASTASVWSGDARRGASSPLADTLQRARAVSGQSLRELVQRSELLRRFR